MNDQNATEPPDMTPRPGAPGPTSPARVLTARAQAAATRALQSTRTAAARANAPNTPIRTVHTWFTRPALNLKSLHKLATLVGLSPAALLLSDEDRAVIEEAARSCTDAGRLGVAEALYVFLNGDGGGS